MKRKHDSLIDSEDSADILFGTPLRAIVSVMDQQEKLVRSKGLKFTKFATPQQYFTDAMQRFKRELDDDKYNARYVVTNSGKLWLSDVGRIKKKTPHHNDMALDEKLQSATVIAAGRLHFDEHGVIDSINNHSGHYKPEDDSIKWLLLVLSTMKEHEAFAVSNTLSVENKVADTEILDTSISKLLKRYDYAEVKMNEITSQIHKLNSNTDAVEIETRSCKRRKMKNPRGLLREFEESGSLNDNKDKNRDDDNNKSMRGPR